MEEIRQARHAEMEIRMAEKKSKFVRPLVQMRTLLHLTNHQELAKDALRKGRNKKGDDEAEATESPKSSKSSKPAKSSKKRVSFG